MHKSGGDLLTCVETAEGVKNWPSTASLSPSTREAITAAPVVFLPEDGFRDYAGPVFPAGTNEFFLFIRSKVSSSDQVEIAVEDSQYVELALHGRKTQLATLFVTLYLAPTLANLSGAFLATRLGSEFNSTQVHATMIVEDTKGANKKSWKLTYEGPASTYEKTIKEALSHLSPGDQTATKHEATKRAKPAEPHGKIGHKVPTKDSKPCQ